MATSPQGIMALPQEAQQASPQISIDDSYDAVRGGLSDASPEASAQVQETLNQLLPALDQLSDEDLDQLIQTVQYMHDHEEEYANAVATLIKQGVVDEGTFPSEYDPEFIATLGMVLLEAKRQRMQSAPQQMPQPPMQLARGGIAEAARMVASHGRYGDTMLAHINKDEARLLKKRGGSGTINPKTGLPEFWGLGNITRGIQDLGQGAVDIVRNPVGTINKAVNTVVGGVKDVVSSPIGRIIAVAALATFLGPGAFGVAGMNLGVGASLGLASAGVTALGGGNIKDIIRSGAQGYFIGSLAGPAGSTLGAATGVTNAAAQAAMGAGAASTALGVLSGKGLKASITEGLTSAAIAGLSTGATKGFGAQAPGQAPVPGEAPAQGPLTPDQVNQQISEMAKGQTGNVSGQYNPATGKFEVPVSDAGTAANPQGPVIAAGGATAQNQIDLNTRVANMQAPAGAPPINPDPLGDFIAKNNAMTTEMGNTPMGEPTTFQSIKNAMFPSNPTANDIIDSKDYKNLVAKGISPDTAYATVKADMTPSTLAKYGPSIGAGLGIAALTGGFKPKTVSPSQGSQDLMSGKASQDIINANPSRYITQGMPGVTYDASGNITGSSAGWTPRSGYGTTEVAGNYLAYTPSAQNTPMYGAPNASIGGGQQIAQSYNRNPYDFYPRYAADGGYMQQTSPAFPGTPLNSPPSPLRQQPSGMLPMNTSGMPMNTSGMPMNLPMGYAMGGIAGSVANAVRPASEAAAQYVASQAPQQAPQAAQQAFQVAQQYPSQIPINMASLVQQANSYSEEMQKAANARIAAYYARQRAEGHPVQNQQAGIASLNTGGYPRRNGQISGPGTETSDSIPAMLSDGEFVMTAKAVKALGKGNRRAGAKKMYALMHHLEKNAARG
jgi:hypothetical protein